MPSGIFIGAHAHTAQLSCIQSYNVTLNLRHLLMLTKYRWQQHRNQIEQEKRISNRSSKNQSNHGAGAIRRTSIRTYTQKRIGSISIEPIVVSFDVRVCAVHNQRVASATVNDVDEAK